MINPLSRRQWQEDRPVHGHAKILEDFQGVAIPTGTRVIVTKIKPKEVQRGGIVLPVEVQDGSSLGKVVAVGPGVSLDIQPGDPVIYHLYGPLDISLRGIPDSKGRQLVDGGLDFVVMDEEAIHVIADILRE